MKIVKRIGIFETNSSSTHTLTLVSKTDYEADKETSKPKYRKYEVIATKQDKLLMACGCCTELFEDRFFDFVSEESLISACTAAVGWFVRVYCELTGEDYDKTFAEIDAINRSGRACHMKFFDEGALIDSMYDYMIIDNMLDGDIDDVLSNIRHYFDDDFLLLYHECFGSGGWLDDD